MYKLDYFVKYLLILFLGIIIIPTLAQNSTINQTDYQKFETSINNLQIKLQQLNVSITGLQTDHQKLENSINDVHTEYKNLGGAVNETRTELQKDFQNLGQNINETRVEAKNYYIWSLYASGVCTIIAFLGGVAIATSIYFRQKSEQVEIKNLISRVEQISSRQEEVSQEVREDVAHGLSGKLEVVILNLAQCIHLFELRDQETDPTKRINFMHSMANEYDRCFGILNLEINIIELMRIFGRATARQYWTLLNHLGIHSSIYIQSDDDLQSFIWHVNECLGLCLELNDVILPLASDQVRSRRE